jgi:hypothetical protein
MLYRDPQHGSPVRGDPGDLLLIPGFNFSPSAYVIYQAIADTTQRLSPPSPLPSGQTAASGKIVPMAVGTNAVKVQLPTVMTAGQSYAIWVVNPSGVSFDIKINDARPMWLSPGPLASARQPSYPYVYRSTDRPGLNREIKIVGRNLQPAPGAQTKVRLARYLLDCGAADSIPGPVFVLTAAADGNPATQVDFGPGLAQSRKITDARELMPGHVTFAVSPPFDVVPSLGSRIIIYQQTWQIYIVDNAIDNACSHTLTFTVHLDAQPAGDMVVTATSTDGNMAAVSPAPLVFTPSNYAMPLAVTVTQLTPQFVSAQTSMTLRRRGYANKTVAVSIDDGSQSGDGREGEVNRWLGRKF